VEIVSRLLGRAVAGSEVASTRVTGVSTLKSFDPPLDDLAGRRIAGMRRRGKHLVVDFDGGLSLLIHLMSAGRLQLFDKPGSLRDKTSRLLVRLTDGRELRLREFGTRHHVGRSCLKPGNWNPTPRWLPWGRMPGRTRRRFSRCLPIPVL